MAMDSLLTTDSQFPSFCHLGHDPYTGYMHYQCPYCHVLLLVDPMKMLGTQCVQGMPHHDKAAFDGNDKGQYGQVGSSWPGKHTGMG